MDLPILGSVSPPPAHPKIYHITHVGNLASIIAADGLFSDAIMIARGGPTASIGMSEIKQRRLTLPVSCHQGDNVGDYVPFYFGPRSIMLYVIHRQNHQDLAYDGGQELIVHLEADLDAVVAWANQARRRWAFSLSNAGARYTQFRASLGALNEVDWAAVNAADFRRREIREGKQAEFLLHGSFPWSLVTRIGVESMGIQAQANSIIATATHKPRVEVKPEWYYS